MKATFGTYTNGAGDSGGDIDTGLKKVYFMWLQSRGAAVSAEAPTINETINSPPIDGSAVTIVTTLDDDGIWMAVGK
jgi:hypothetical protein